MDNDYSKATIYFKWKETIRNCIKSTSGSFKWRLPAGTELMSDPMVWSLLVEMIVVKRLKFSIEGDVRVTIILRILIIIRMNF